LNLLVPEDLKRIFALAYTSSSGKLVVNQFLHDLSALQFSPFHEVEGDPKFLRDVMSDYYNSVDCFESPAEEFWIRFRVDLSLSSDLMASIPRSFCLHPNWKSGPIHDPFDDFPVSRYFFF
jgi:hypothetical protein